MSKKKTASLGMFTRIVGSQGFVSVLSVLIAFAIGAILIAATGASVTDAYYAMPAYAAPAIIAAATATKV